ncbi:MAG: scyllo-inosose 3-dehydrogenase [Armatimonadota bacterium]|nr:scyllo-inosose 3-dehydrogenase [Armatimonadota bacterium]MDR7451977.1 scyllo-inosose 3-dehydrogenase [Armatimonadota bacterium]MDR7468370.1 scyllo-inosose 3-dehydrogenase [Armatimonadota bacterium]MDR7494279.1 scyllo-inosose 3-dehydrogenase [Armatimonadota bacterium]MDR7505510.1 scyllo-inosose 3-dehydrogenase [Armatimonadota bacterium]
MRGLVLAAEWDPRPDYRVSEWERRTGKAVTGSSVWRSPRLSLESIAEPRPGPGEVLIRPRACGVCGSDVHFYETDADGYMLYPGLTKFPVVIGHEFSGEVVEVGRDVTDLKPGDMVTAEEMIWCGECTPCRNGYPNQCLRLEEIGFTINGAQADYIAIGAKYCWKIDALAERYGSREKAYEAGALCEPTSVSYNAMFTRAEGFKPGGHVVVFGTGPIGFAAIALARAAGAAKIIAFEVSPVRQELARKVGADVVLDPVALERQGTAPRQAIMELTDGEGAAMLVEAAGAPPRTIPEMEAAMAVGGKIVMIGRASERAPVYLEHFQTHAAQIYGAQGHSGYGNFPNVIRLMASGRIDLTPIITSRFTLDQGVEAIKKATRREDGKIMIRA